MFVCVVIVDPSLGNKQTNSSDMWKARNNI